MTLRQTCMEAIERTLKDQHYTTTYEEDAAAALDALLSTLTEHADQWFKEWTDHVVNNDGDPDFAGLLDALRSRP